MPKPRIIFYSPKFKTRALWDYTTPYTTGCGGSEMCHIELSSELAKLGHEVISYAPIPDDKVGTIHNGVTWLSCQEHIYGYEGIWVINRTLQPLDEFPKNDKYKCCIFLHDVAIDEEWTPERVAKIDKVFVLSNKHAWFLGQVYPHIKDKLHVMNSGFDLSLIEEVEGLENVTRDPHKLIWASSPDRGLFYLLDMFMEAKEFVPDLSLDIFYGTDFLDVRLPKHKAVQEKMDKYSIFKGITYRGKVPRRDIVRAWLKSGIWCYPSMFLEIFCMATVEAQACGAIPIVNPLWGVAEHTHFGKAIQGDPWTDSLTQARFVENIIQVALNPKWQDEMRTTMMPTIRGKYSWNTVAKEWSQLLCQML